MASWVSGRGFEDARRRQRRVATGADLEWADVYREYLPRVRVYVRGRVPAAWVEDAAQDTFVRAYRSRHRFDPSRPLWPWLATIARRACIETCRAHPFEVAFDPGVHGGVATDDPHLEAERSEQAEVIRRALGSVAPRHRQLLVGYEVEGRPFAALAADHCISSQALKSALCRARESFRSQFSLLAEQRGLVALPIVGPAVARLRRWLRTLGVLPLPAELAGLVFVGITATAVFVGIPVGPRAQSAVMAGHSADAVVAGTGVVASATDTADTAVPAPAEPTPTPAPAPDGPSAADPSSPRPGPDTTRTPKVDGNADVGFTPTGSTATLTLEWSGTEHGGLLEAAVTIECDGAVWGVVCDAARATPQGS